ncbi:MAG: gliding motility lipoprotein GldH [Flavobacteriaceae bacterium]|jgi:gliding motility-associated lipoprotein GldH|nr:gliding motility lipoprotein GldH [Flavobacteriaceae bacterium]
MKKIFLLLFLISLTQCSRHYEYAETVNIKNFWHKKNALNFDFEIKNPQQPKNLFFIVRNNNNYSFSNLYLFISLKQNGKILETDTLNYPLAKPTGEWLGTGTGSVKEIEFQYKKNFKFPEKGRYTLSVIQGMRKDTLEGIEDFGLIIN